MVPKELGGFLPLRDIIDVTFRAFGLVYRPFIGACAHFYLHLREVDILQCYQETYEHKYF